MVILREKDKDGGPLRGPQGERSELTAYIYFPVPFNKAIGLA